LRPIVRTAAAIDSQAKRVKEVPFISSRSVASNSVMTALRRFGPGTLNHKMDFL
jgi:hypothetical protein